MSKATVLARAVELGIHVEQYKCPVYREWTVELFCAPGYVFADHGLHGLTAWHDSEPPQWADILTEIERNDITPCSCEACLAIVEM